MYKADAEHDKHRTIVRESSYSTTAWSGAKMVIAPNSSVNSEPMFRRQGRSFPTSRVSDNQKSNVYFHWTSIYESRFVIYLSGCPSNTGWGSCHQPWQGVKEANISTRLMRAALISVNPTTSGQQIYCWVHACVWSTSRVCYVVPIHYGRVCNKRSSRPLIFKYCWPTWVPPKLAPEMAAAITESDSLQRRGTLQSLRRVGISHIMMWIVQQGALALASVIFLTCPQLIGIGQTSSTSATGKHSCEQT